MASLVFVCWGNICRSPIGERVAMGMASQRGLDLEVSSFGLSGENEGMPIDDRAVAVLRGSGYDTEGHGARQIGREDIEAADLVIAVEPYQVEKLRRMVPGAENIKLLNDYNPDLGPGTPLIDPWYGDAEGFNDTLADVEAAMPAILDEFVS
ncbi:MAG: low molecular weight protein-tyrosine-phosphatase [Propionibacteriaceae bacterium]|nr:low molecular weight protein-tyrosine-phosphatase [Propionibacteriaceae bacterium]